MCALSENTTKALEKRQLFLYNETNQFLKGVTNMPGDLTYFKRNAVNYYGVFLRGFDKGNPYKDKLTVVRKSYYESGLQTQKRKFTDMGEDGKVYKYNYTLNEDTALKWKVVNTANRVLERVPPQRDGDDYRVEIRDNFGKILKCIYFGPYHNWIKTKYYSSDSTEPVVELAYWDKNGMAAILKYTAGGDDNRPEVLHPCKVVEDQSLLQKIVDKLGVPEVSTLCSNGYVYFANDRIARRWERCCADPSLLDEGAYDSGFGAPYSETTGKKVDLTQTDDVIVPEKAAADSIVFDFGKDSDKPLPSRKLGINKPSEQPELPKLHSESLLGTDIYESNMGEPKRDVFDLLFSEEEKKKSAEEEKKLPDLSEKKDEIAALPDKDDTIGSGDEEDKLDEELLSDDDDDLDEGGSSIENITKEFDIPSASQRSYGYKRVRPIMGDDNADLGERAGMKTMEFMRQSLSEALGEPIENDKPTLAKKPEPITKKPEPAQAAAPVAPPEPGVNAPGGRLSPAKVIKTSTGDSYYYYGELNERGERHGKGRTSMHGDLTAYDGMYSHDKRDGFGAYYYSNGKICYIGDWSANRRNGVGISFKSKDRSMYVGSWENNCPVGIGVKFDENGNFKYIGKYEQGVLEGVGVSYLPDEEMLFVSRMEDEKPSQKGTLFDSEGNLLYHGTLVDGKRSGIGTQYNADGQVSYHGGWKDGMFHGQGVLSLPNGCRVSGSFVMGKIEGHAVFTTKRGKKLYEGEWVRNRFHGEGKKYDIKTGSWYSGRFAEGRPVGILSCFDRDGKLVYEGELRNELFHGAGVGYEDGEKVYDGEWKNGVRSGTGSEYKDGRVVYKGKFKDNVRRGIGTSYTPDGKLEYSGHWAEGRKDGEGLLYKDGKPYLAGNFSMGVLDGRVNEIKNGTVVKECIYSDGKCVYMREFTEDGLCVKYEGYVKDGIYEGMGCGFSQYGEKYFEGIFKGGKPFKSMKVRLQRLDDLPVRAKLIGSEYSRFIKGPNYVIEREIGQGSYSGLLVGGRPFGKGTIIYTDHGYTGAFEDGVACGLGVIYEWDGSEIKGTFAKTASVNTTEITLASGITYHLLNESR